MSPVQDGSGFGIYQQRYESVYLATEQTASDLKGGMSIADVDAGAATVTATLSVDYGILNVTAGTSGAIVSGSGTSSVTITGTIAQINDLLGSNATSSVEYVANSDAPPASATLTLSVDDGGNTGSGGAQIGSATETIVITPVDDAAIAQADAFSTAEDVVATGNVFADNGSGVDSDPDGTAPVVAAVNGDSAAVGAQITLTSGALLTLNADGTFSYDPNGAFDALPGPGSGASNTSATDSFTYSLADGATATVTVTINGTDSANDRLEGTSGNDTLDGGTGADTMIGYAGDDVYIVDDAGDVVTELASEGLDWVHSSVSHTLADNVENLTLTGTAAVDGTGNALDNRLFGNSAANLLSGGAGNDWLDGGAGADTMIGGAGDDVYIVDDSGDVVTELANEGLDRVHSSVDYPLADTVENLTLTGTAAVDGTGNALDNRLFGNSAANTLSGGVGNDWLDGGAGADTLAGGTGDDMLRGSYGPDTLDGGDGADKLYGGGGGRDTLTGGVGNDWLDGGGGDDSMAGGAGKDTYVVHNLGDTVTELAGEGLDMVLSKVSWTLGDTVERLQLLGTANIDGTGNGLKNLMFGNSGNNVLSGLGASDSLYGRDGADTLYGGDGADFVYGGDGDDWIEGGARHDIVSGDTGADNFVFRDGDFAGLTSTSSDLIKDFSQAEGDKIRLDAVDANTLVGGDQAFQFIGTSAFTNTAGELRYETVDGNTYVYGDTDGDGAADFMISLLGTHALVVGDFVI